MVHKAIGDGSFDSMTSIVMFVLLALTGAQFIVGHAQDIPLFQCQPSSEQDGLVFTPNIPDFYFNHENAEAFMTAHGANLTSLSASVAYIFTIPPVSSGRDCSGTVAAIQFCYEYRDDDKTSGTMVEAFQFVTLTRDGFDFTVNSSFTVQTTLTACTDGPPGDIRRVCCSKVTSNDFGELVVPSSDFVFGVAYIMGSQLLAFGPMVTEYQFDQFQVVTIGFSTVPGATTQLAQSNFLRDRSLPLLRFFIGTAASTEDDSITASLSVPATAASTEDDDSITTSLSVPTIAATASTDDDTATSSSVTNRATTASTDDDGADSFTSSGALSEATTPIANDDGMDSTTINSSALGGTRITIIGGVVGGIVAVVLILLLTLIIILLVRRRPRKTTSNNNMVYNNPVYEVTEAKKDASRASAARQEANEATTDGPVYSVVNVSHKKRKSSKPVPIQSPSAQSEGTYSVVTVANGGIIEGEGYSAPDYRAIDGEQEAHSALGHTTAAKMGGTAIGEVYNTLDHSSKNEKAGITEPNAAEYDQMTVEEYGRLKHT